MRVLCVGVRYPPHHTGGYELHCRSVVEDLKAHGHEAAVLTSTLRNAGVDDAEEEPGVRRELGAFDPHAPWPGWRAAWTAERANVGVLRRTLASVKPDVVCWWRLGELSLSLVEHVRRAGLPAVGVVCDQWLLEGPARDPWQRPWIDRDVWRIGALGAHASALRPAVERLTRMPVAIDWSAAAHWLFVSQWLRERTLANGRPLASTGVAHAGIDRDRLPFRVPPPWRGRLLYAGRLSALKGADDAVAALAATAGTLTVHGHGTPCDHARLRAAARAAGVEARVHLEPPLTAGEMPAAYAAHDALLFPSRWDEPWGLVPLEAMAVGLPVVATGTGGSREYLRPGENALRVPPGDPAGLAAAVRALADDEPLRARLAAAGRETAERHPAAAGNAVVREALERAAPIQARNGAGRAPHWVARCGPALPSPPASTAGSPGRRSGS